MKKFLKYIIFFSFGTILIIFAVLLSKNDRSVVPKDESPSGSTKNISQDPSGDEAAKEQLEKHSMAIESLRQAEYVGGSFSVERALPDGTNYHQYVVSYYSEDLKIYGLLTVPFSPKPKNGYPAVVFVHGYIPPPLYSTTGSYPTYQATLARGGFVTFKPDLRGHGNSQGEPVSAHFSEKYVIDTLNAIAYLKNYPDVDPARIGYWGHSNGGEIGLRIAVIEKEIKAAVFWAGVVGSFEDMLETYNSKIPFLADARENELVKQNGLPSDNQDFWNKLDPYSYLRDISIPIQLHHGTNDSSVPIELSLHLRDELEKLGKQVEYFEYPGDDHNISANSSLAWKRSIDFLHENLR